MSNRPLSCVAANVLALLSTAAPLAASSEVLESCNGGFELSWYVWQVPAQTSFGMLDGCEVSYLSASLGSPQFNGFGSNVAMQGNNATLEARVNTMSQSGSHPGAIIILSLGAPGSGPSLTTYISLSVGEGGGDRKVACRHSPSSQTIAFHFTDDTWYRLRIRSSDDGVRLSLLGDDGQELAHMAHATPLSGSTTYRPYFGVFTGTSAQVAVDFIHSFANPTCEGDANRDGVVDAADLSVLLTGFNGIVATGSGADFNENGRVEAADLSVLLSKFGEGC